MQAGPSTSEPQVSCLQTQSSQAILQQPFVVGIQQPQANLPFIGMTQTYTGLIYSQLGQTYIGGKQPLHQQPWKP